MQRGKLGGALVEGQRINFCQLVSECCRVQIHVYEYIWGSTSSPKILRPESWMMAAPARTKSIFWPARATRTTLSLRRTTARPTSTVCTPSASVLRTTSG